MRNPAAFLLLAAALALPAHAATGSFPGTDDLRHLRALGPALLSPDGHSVLFSVTDATADGGRTHLWLVPADGSHPARQLTVTPSGQHSGESAPAWSPDGRAVYFLAHRGEQNQLFRLSLQGGEAMPISLRVLPSVDDARLPDAIPAARKAAAATPAPLPLSLSGYAVSPDGHWLAVWARDPQTPGEKAAHDAKADAIWVDHQTHRTRLYLARIQPDGSILPAAASSSTTSSTAASGPVLAPVALPGNLASAAWSPASDRLLAITRPPNDLDDLGPANQAWLVPIAAQPQRLAHAPATLRSPIAWSPDGSRIFFAAQTPEDAPPGVEELQAMAAAPDAQPQRLLPDFDGSLGYGKPVVLADGRVLVAVERGFTAGTVTVPAAASSGAEATPVPQSSATVTALATNRARSGWVWLASSSDQPTRLCYAPQLGGD